MRSQCFLFSFFLFPFLCRQRAAPLRRRDLELERGRPLGGARDDARAPGGRGRRRACVRAAAAVNYSRRSSSRAKREDKREDGWRRRKGLQGEEDAEQRFASCSRRRTRRRPEEQVPRKQDSKPQRKNPYKIQGPRNAYCNYGYSKAKADV